jgi:hypothetical protein
LDRPAAARALGGRIDQANHLFGRACGFASGLGLFSEEVDPKSGEPPGRVRRHQHGTGGKPSGREKKICKPCIFSYY